MTQAAKHALRQQPTQERVTRWLDDVRHTHPEHHALVQALRALVLGLDAAITEEVKYGGLLFGKAKHFCGVFAYTQHVSLEFGEGAALADAYQVLEGKGKGRRHIKLRSLEDANAKQALHYVKLALAAPTAPG